jgi:hypothetical protein
MSYQVTVTYDNPHDAEYFILFNNDIIKHLTDTYPSENYDSIINSRVSTRTETSTQFTVKFLFPSKSSFDVLMSDSIVAARKSEFDDWNNSVNITTTISETNI